MTLDSELAGGEIFGRTLDLLVDLCALSSPTGDADGLRQVAARLDAELTRRGFSCDLTEEIDTEGVLQPVLAAIGPGATDRRILLVGHMDTVLTAIPPRVAGDRLEATGAVDMKGGFAALLGALDLLAAEGRPLPAGLTLVAVPDEESNGAISERVLRRWGEGARVILVLEPGELRGDGESLVGGRRGLTEWHLDVVGQSAHSGLAYWAGRSALVAAADWCVRAQALSGRPDGPTVNVGRLVAGTSDFVDGPPGSHALLGSSRQRNTIPDRAVAEGEVRYLSDEDGAAAVVELDALAAAVAISHEVRVTLTPGKSVPPVDPSGPGVELANVAVELAAARGFRLEIENDRGGISFSNYLAGTASVPAVDGLGPVGGGMHTRGEWLDLRSLGRRIALLADLLATL